LSRVEPLLSVAEPWLAWTCAAGAAGALAFFPDLRAALKAPGARAWLAAAVLAASGAALAGPSRHVVFFDEYTHLAIAETLDATGRLCEAKLGSTIAPELCELPPWVGGYHASLALAFKLFGATERVAFAFSRLAGAAAVIAVFLAGFSLAGQVPALLAAALVAFSPTHALFSAATETGMLAAFAVGIVVWALSLCRSRDGAGPRVLLACSLGFALLVRLENILLLPLVVAALPRSAGRARTLAEAAAGVALAAATAAAALHVQYALTSHLRATNAGLWTEFPSTFLKDAAFWGREWFFIPLVLAGAWELSRSKPKRWLLWWAAAFLAFYCAFAAPFSDAASSRYALTPLVLLALAAGTGARALSRLAPARARPLLAAALLVALLRSAAPGANAPLEEEQRRANDGRGLLERSRPLLPPGGYFVTFAPSYVGALTGLKAALPRDLDGLRGPLLLSKDPAWYLSTAVYPDLEGELLARFKFRPLTSERPGAEGPGNFSIVVLEPRE
jgi:hypothetical protein